MDVLWQEQTVSKNVESFIFDIQIFVVPETGEQKIGHMKRVVSDYFFSAFFYCFSLSFVPSCTMATHRIAGKGRVHHYSRLSPSLTLEHSYI